MLVALLDTSVLWPSLQRDFLLSLAAEGLYRPVWSTAILAELEWHEQAKLRRLGMSGPQAEGRAQRLVAEMRRAFNDAEVAGYEALEGSYGLPDPDDEHVVAAAVLADAKAIVTLNARDFPAGRLPAGIDVLPPAEFTYGIVLAEPTGGLRAVAEIAARSGSGGRMPRSIDGILDVLAGRYDMGDTAQVLRSADRLL